MNDEFFAPILAMALHFFLEENEGVIIDFDGGSYLVSKQLTEDDEYEVSITINDDPSLSTGQKVWLHDEPVGNA